MEQLLAIPASPLPGDLNAGTGHEGPGASEACLRLDSGTCGVERPGMVPRTHVGANTLLAPSTAHTLLLGGPTSKRCPLPVSVPSAPRHQGEGLTGGGEAETLRVFLCPNTHRRASVW